MRKLGEIFAFILLIGSMIIVPILIYAYAPWKSSNEQKVIYLTAVAKKGVWTDERVNSFNFRNKDLSAAHIVLTKGEEVLFRFTSADVTHSFYIPELDLGPIVVEAGYTYDVPFKADTTGTFTYYCTTVCGHCHFYMQGVLTVIDEGEIPDTTSMAGNQQMACLMNHESNKEISESNFIISGKNIFEEKGCISCHGKNGQGGVKNPYYVKNEVPSLNNLASTLKIDWPEDGDAIIYLLEKNADFQSLEDSEPIENYSRFLAQYNSIINKIMVGADSLQTVLPENPQPPLVMPAWEHHLSKKEINAVIAYMITLNDWE